MTNTCTYKPPVTPDDPDDPGNDPDDPDDNPGGGDNPGDNPGGNDNPGGFIIPGGGDGGNDGDGGTGRTTGRTTPTGTIDDPTPPTTIIDPTSPTAGTGFWALINLICAVLTALLSLVLLGLYFTRRKHQQDGDDDGEETESTIKKKGVARVLSLIPAIGGIILFILTEDMDLPMRLVDKWTIWMALILLVNVVIAIASKKKKKEEDEDEEDMPYQASANDASSAAQGAR